MLQNVFKLINIMFDSLFTYTSFMFFWFKYQICLAKSWLKPFLLPLKLWKCTS